MGNILKIRAHHLLCLQGYQGYGYSRAFERRMDKLQKQIGTTAGLEFEVTAENDAVCALCPHLKENECRRDKGSPAKMREIDLNVLSILKIKEKTVTKARRLFSLVNNKLKTVSALNGICGGCGWHEKCLWYMSRASD